MVRSEAQQCTMASLAYIAKPTADLAGIKSSSAAINVEPWQTELRVILLFRSKGEYVEVMEVEGASLLQREQMGAFLRLVFVLDDEPGTQCKDAACFTLETVGSLGRPDACCADPRPPST